MLGLVNTPGAAAPGKLRDLPEPQPAANEALVAVRAFSLNRGELRLLQTRPEGWRPGQEISGIVIHAAADGSGPQPGARVVALTADADWAQRAPGASHRLAVSPDNVGFEEAAAVHAAGLTALRGKRVLVTGAAGGVGHLAVQIATCAGAHVAAVAATPGRGRHLIGAETIISGSDQAQGHSLVLEAVGGASLATAIALSSPRERSSSSGTRRARRHRSIFATSPSTRMRAFRASSISVLRPRRTLRRTSRCWRRWSATVLSNRSRSKAAGASWRGSPTRCAIGRSTAGPSFASTIAEARCRRGQKSAGLGRRLGAAGARDGREARR
jgi:NADPH:quinone reductase-like Zn-dependent oxidoreductase